MMIPDVSTLTESELSALADDVQLRLADIRRAEERNRSELSDPAAVRAAIQQLREQLTTYDDSVAGFDAAQADLDAELAAYDMVIAIPNADLNATPAPTIKDLARAGKRVARAGKKVTVEGKQVARSGKRVTREVIRSLRLLGGVLDTSEV